MDFLKDLNNKQYEAVSTSSQIVRVIAGAGSGKTRVLTYRIAYLLNERYANPWSILAITFTNKVAKEMKDRVAKLVPDCSNSLNIRTFHSFAAFFLRQEISVLGFPASFAILDEEDQTKIIKDIAQSHGYKRGDSIVGRATHYICSCKLKGLYPQDIYIKHEEFEDQKLCLEMYEEYESIKNRMFALDFDDLLLKANEILENNPMIQSKWQNKIDYILVDEFQDTNDTEYKLIKLLLKPSTELYVVGDPDQTIYTWRGANQKIIIDLNKRYPNINTIPLEQNYRSTQVILDAANKLISHNKLRIPKNLFTDSKGGTPIEVKNSFSSKDEALNVINQIKSLKQKFNYSYKDFVILYRSNYISVDFETALVAANIPYQVYGGMKFFQRKEVKDVLAYFSLISNTRNDVAFERIINVPRRGIGESSVELIKKEAIDKDLSLYETIKNAEDGSAIPNRALFPLKAMIKRIDMARDEMSKEGEVFSKILEELIQDIGYYDYLAKEEDGEERIENVKQLFQDLRSFLHNDPEATFDSYLQNIALVSSQDDMLDGDYVSLMTVHTAKGLEFPVVFVVRFNESVFPNQRATIESGYEGMEEERRLAYVAFTRAKEKLFVTLSQGYSYVAGGELTPSKFIEEAGLKMWSGASQKPMYAKSNSYADIYKKNDDDFMKLNVPPAQSVLNKVKATNGIEDWAVGEICYHKSFGRGVVVELLGDGIIKVDFESQGLKQVMGNHPSVSKGE